MLTERQQNGYMCKTAVLTAVNYDSIMAAALKRGKVL